MGKTSRVAFSDTVSVCGNSVAALCFFSEAVPQVSQAFETQINFCENRLKNQLAVTGYVTTVIGKTQECQLA